MFCSRCNFSLKNSTQLGNSPNYSLFTEKNTTAFSSVEMVLVSSGLQRNALATRPTGQFFPLNHQVFIALDNGQPSSNILSFRHAEMFDTRKEIMEIRSEC